MNPLHNGYLPIAEHGIIGDLHTVALVGTDGTIDWYCCPRFDSPSVFASLLDKDKGGFFRIAPPDECQVKQLYLPDTNILFTRFLTPDGVGEVTDFMPIGRQHALDEHRMVRSANCVRGTMTFRIECRPRFDYARAEHTLERHEHGVLFRGPELTLTLESDAQMTDDGRDVTFEITLNAGERVNLSLASVAPDYVPTGYSIADGNEAFQHTIDFWRRWIGRSVYRGRWREMVNRSALTLKLLTYAPTGAIVAAPTTSLPEVLGGGRNWDYRYTWIRDAAFSLYALLRLGFTEEAGAFMDWLTDRYREDADGHDGPLQIMYGIDGRSELEETTLDHLEGYMGSKPVRIGNGAADQLQLDIYGELIDSIYLYNKYGEPISYDAWQSLTGVVNWLSDNWDRPDEGIWETRGGRQHFTYSRLMSWVAIERMVRMSRQRGLPADMTRWLHVRDTIAREVMEKGWNAKRGAFTQHYDTEVLDASLLLMPLTKFIAPARSRGGSRRWTRSATSWSPTAWSTATTPSPRPTGWTATRAPSRSARSGGSRRWPVRAGWTRPGWCSRRC